MIRRTHRLIRLTITWAITAALVVIVGSPAFACVCDGTIGLEAIIEEYDGAFVGTVTDVVGGEHTVSAATFRVESVVKGQFDPLVNVRGGGTSCALELEVGQRTGMLLTGDPSEGWGAGLCGQVPADELLAAAPSTSAPIAEVATTGAGGSPTSFPWWLMGLAVGILITGAAIVLVRRRRPAD